MSEKIPVSVLVVTKNEADKIERCLRALSGFDEVIVVDSESGDGTEEIAKSCGVEFKSFQWNGQYPKKRQWCLDHLNLKYERVFFVDADEVVSEELLREIAALDWGCSGYFVRGAYVWNGQHLKYGLKNNKLVLFDRRVFEFPLLDDLDIEGMGEIEGHYQPVLKDGVQGSVGQLRGEILHYAAEDKGRWRARHEGYADWEAGIDRRGARPQEVSVPRKILKRVFYVLPCRPIWAFLHCYVLKLGFLDGRAGFDFAKSRAMYYRMIAQRL